MNELYIGVMSGTSMDGVDVALCEINSTSCTLLSSYEHPFLEELKNEILLMINGKTTLEQVGSVDVKLAYLFSEAINEFVKKEHIDTAKIRAIGLHGQTLWHNPQGRYPFSMQLGNPSMVSVKTGMKVVADFRNTDVANGGEGAPFAPAFHKFLFAYLGNETAVVNIGGMANITVLSEPLRGWDIGVGNALLDYWSMKCNNKPYDKDGEFAACGNVIDSLLNRMLNDEYFHKQPPKSTGREYFNPKWLEKYLSQYSNSKNEDIQRTLLELSAKLIADTLNTTQTKLLIPCGGGAKNGFLMERIRQLCINHVKICDQIEINSDFLEAMAFAWLAYKRVHNEEVDLKSVTGAGKNSILGGIYG